MRCCPALNHKRFNLLLFFVKYFIPLGVTNCMICNFSLTATLNALGVNIPAGGRPDDFSSQVKSGFRDFIFRSDHLRFWNAEPSLPAVFITDTANFRGYMKQCYRQSCDDINHVTPDMITFLARTTESVVAVASNMTKEKCETKQAGKCLTSRSKLQYRMARVKLFFQFAFVFCHAWDLVLFLQTVGRKSRQIKVKLLLHTSARRTLTKLTAHGPFQWKLVKMISFSSLPLLIWSKVQIAVRTTWK